jgi:hypothetical protein
VTRGVSFPIALIIGDGAQGMMAGHKNAFDCIKAFSETDFTEDLKKIVMPTLMKHCARARLAGSPGEPPGDDGRSAPRGPLRPDADDVSTLTGQEPLSVQDFVRKNAARFTASSKAA